MKKAATILLWISMGFGLLYVIATVVGAVIGGATAPVGNASGYIYVFGLLYNFLRTGVPFVGKILFVIIILFTMKSKIENIVAEIAAIIIFANNGWLLNYLISTVISVIVARYMGTAELASYSSLSMGASWAGSLYNISQTLFLVGVSFAIAYKKVELPDLRRILEEEDV